MRTDSIICDLDSWYDIQINSVEPESKNPDSSAPKSHTIIFEYCIRNWISEYVELLFLVCTKLSATGTEYQWVVIRSEFGLNEVYDRCTTTTMEYSFVYVRNLFDLNIL